MSSTEDRWPVTLTVGPLSLPLGTIAGPAPGDTVCGTADVPEEQS